MRKTAIITNIRRESESGTSNGKIATICRRVCKEIACRSRKTAGEKQTFIAVTAENIEKYLGVPKFRRKRQNGNPHRFRYRSGVDQCGGDILSVDVTIMRGAERLTLTGQLGDVMKESAQAALSYIRSKLADIRSFAGIQ